MAENLSTQVNQIDDKQKKKFHPECGKATFNMFWSVDGSQKRSISSIMNIVEMVNLYIDAAKIIRESGAPYYKEVIDMAIGFTESLRQIIEYRAYHLSVDRRRIEDELSALDSIIDYELYLSIDSYIDFN